MSYPFEECKGRKGSCKPCPLYKECSAFWLRFWAYYLAVEVEG